MFVLDASMPDDVDPYVDPTEFQTPKNEYIAWLDIMGTKNAMRRSVKTAGVKILKMHNAILDIHDSYDIDIFPMMDGVYAVSDDKDKIINFLQDVFEGYANYLVDESEEPHFEAYYTSIIRAAIAFGPLYHGSDTTSQTSQTISDSGEYKDSILIGVPMADAYEAEANAPPFGIFIHESARTIAPDGEEPIPQYWWEWWNDDQLPSDLLEIIEEYFDHFKDSRHSNYDISKLSEHQEVAEAYLNSNY